MHKKYRVTLTLAEREELERMLARVRQLANGPPPKTTLIAKLAGSLVDPGNPARSDPTGATAP